MLQRLGIPGTGTGVIAVFRADGRVDQPQVRVVITPAPHHARQATLSRHGLHQVRRFGRCIQPHPQGLVAHRSHQQKLPVRVTDEHCRQQLVLLQQPRQHRQTPQPCWQGGRRGHRVERQQADGGIGRVHDAVYPFGNELADALRTLVRRRNDGLARAGADLVHQQRCQQQHGGDHHGGDQDLKGDGDAAPPWQVAALAHRSSARTAKHSGRRRVLGAVAQGVHALHFRVKAGVPSPSFWQPWLPHHSGWCRRGDRYISPVAA